MGYVRSAFFFQLPHFCCNPIWKSTVIELKVKKMKNQKLNLALLFMLAVIAWSCESKENIQGNAPVQQGREFTVRYLIPLTTGRDNGETMIVDPVHAQSTNVDELRPVIAQVVDAALKGDVPTYPGDFEEDSQNDPKTYMKRQFDLVGSTLRPVQAEDMLITLELEYDAEAFKGFSKMNAKFIDLTWADAGKKYPDKNMGRIEIQELERFEVTVGNVKLPLPAYLNRRQFEHYVIRVYAPQDTFGIRTHADALTVQQLLLQGHLDDINPYHRHN
jgi:hypothetical protein